MRNEQDQDAELAAATRGQFGFLMAAVGRKVAILGDPLGPLNGEVGKVIANGRIEIHVGKMRRVMMKDGKALGKTVEVEGSRVLQLLPKEGVQFVPSAGVHSFYVGPSADCRQEVRLS